MKIGDPSEPIFTMPPPHVPVRRVRSTLLVASYKMVQSIGRQADYLSALPKAHHATILDAVVGTWIDVATAIAHYGACDALGLSNEELVEVGRKVGDTIRGTLAGTLVHLSKEVGIDPWNALPVMPRLWPRVFDGGAITGWKRGPKEVRVDLTGSPIFESRYFRNAFRGQIMGMMELFCSKAYVGPRPGRSEPGAYSVRVQWA
jgi:hypothetical protein